MTGWRPACVAREDCASDGLGERLRDNTTNYNNYDYYYYDYYELRTTNYALRATNYELRTPND